MNNIFLIDDDEDDQLLFTDAIELINPALQLDVATNGKIALDQLKVSFSLPDIIFLDLNMPVMNGFEFLTQIKKETQLNKIPIVIFTTSNILRDKELTKEFGAQYFLTKPNNFKALRIELQQILSTVFASD